jgi:hypothetical protein
MFVSHFRPSKPGRQVLDDFSLVLGGRGAPDSGDRQIDLWFGMA